MLAPLIKYWSTPKRAAKVITKAVINEAGQTGVYFDERGEPMASSAQVQDPAFQDRVLDEARKLLKTLPA